MNRRDIFKVAAAGLAMGGKPMKLHGYDPASKPDICYGIVLDASGSMDIVRQATINGYNEHLKSIQEEQDKLGLYVAAFVTIFEYESRMVASGIPLQSLNPLTEEDYVPGGGTALYDAVGLTLSAMEKFGGPSTVYLVTVISDGLENSSKEWTSAALSKRINEIQSKKRWTFSYMGAEGLDLSQERDVLAVSYGSALTYVNTSTGVTTAYVNQATAVNSLMKSVANGEVVDTDSFYSGAGIPPLPPKKEE